jgi:hypothetical protein
MGIASFFDTTCETRELHADAQLRTRYYRNNFDHCVEAIRKLAELHALDLREINKTHGEIYLLGNGFDVIFTVAQITPIECGIDIKINFFGFTGLGRPKKKALAFFRFFDQNLKFKGVSLHP